MKIKGHEYNEKNYITPQGHKKLMEEFEHLWKVERPNITKLLNWAASNGDRSENADYIYGKRRLREIDRRLRFLKKRLELAEVVENEQKVDGHDRVQFGATVTILDEEGEERDYTIVGVDEIDLSRKHISWKSPLGQSLLGKETGDIIHFQSPKGRVEMEIIRVKYGQS